MASKLETVDQRITAVSTWTKLIEAPSGYELFVQLFIANHTANANTVLYVRRPNNSSPSADTEAPVEEVLPKKGDVGASITLKKIIVKSGCSLWIKSNQNDTRIAIDGIIQAVPA